MNKNLLEKKSNKFKFYFFTLLKYKKKIIQVLLFEIFYTFIFKSGFYKIQNDSIKTDSLPCPYYFLNKISKFVKKYPIYKIVDLGSGTGRVVNFLAKTNNAKVFGYEIDEEVLRYAIMNKSKNAYFYKKDITLLNFKKLRADCYILNAPFHKEKDFKNLIKKIEIGNKKIKKKYFLVVINIDSHFKKIKLENIFKNFMQVQHIQAGKIKSLRIFQSKIKKKA